MKNSTGLKYTMGLGLFLGMAAHSMPNAQACSCAPPKAPQEALEQADAVFEGKVQMGGKAPSGGLGVSSAMAPIRFSVLRAWKGAEVGKTISVITSGSTASCGYPFEQGQSYLVYAFLSQKSGELGTGLCSRTRKSTDAAEDFAALAAPKGKEAPAPKLEELPVNSGESSSSGAAPAGSFPSGTSIQSPVNTEGSPPEEAAPPMSVSPALPPEGGGCAACATSARTSLGAAAQTPLFLVALAALALRRALRRSPRPAQ